MAVQQRRYRRLMIGPPRLVGWCDACGFLAEVETGRHDALVARLARHHLSAHVAAGRGDRWIDEPTVEGAHSPHTARAASRAECLGHPRR